MQLFSTHFNSFYHTIIKSRCDRRLFSPMCILLYLLIRFSFTRLCLLLLLLKKLLLFHLLLPDLSFIKFQCLFIFRMYLRFETHVFMNQIIKLLNLLFFNIFILLYSFYKVSRITKPGTLVHYICCLFVYFRFKSTYFVLLMLVF